MTTTTNSEFIEEMHNLVENKVSEWIVLATQLLGSNPNYVLWRNTFKTAVEQCMNVLIEELADQKKAVIDDIEKLLQQYADLCKDLSIPLPVNEIGKNNCALREEKRELQNMVQKLAQKRDKRLSVIQNLIHNEKEYCTILGRVACPIRVSPLPSEDIVQKYKAKIEALAEDVNNRNTEIGNLRFEIIEIETELMIKPNYDDEEDVVSCLDSTLVLTTDEAFEKLKWYHKRVLQQKQDITEQIEQLRHTISDFWDTLDEDHHYRQNFLENNKGVNMDVFQALQAELKRCKAKKIQNIEIFVKKRRDELLSLWDKCYIKQDIIILKFPFFGDNTYTEELLTIHDLEVEKWRHYYEKHSAIFDKVAELSQLWKEAQELAEKENDKDRFKNRGGKLLEEEKQRQKVEKRTKFLEATLKTLAKQFEEDNGKPLKIYEKTIEQFIEDKVSQMKEERKLQLSAKKQLRQQLTPATSKTNLCLSSARSASSVNLHRMTPSSGIKRKILTPQHGSTAAKKLFKNPVAPVPKSTTKKPKIVYSHEKNKRKRRSLKLENSIRSRSSTGELDFKEFEGELRKNANVRSTTFGDSISPLAEKMPGTPVGPKIVVTTGTSPRGTRSSRRLQPANIAEQF